MKKPKTKTHSHRIRHLIDSYPENTNTVKQNLAEFLDCSLDKINRWYRGEIINIKTEDQSKLVEFFGLDSISDLYEQVKSSSKSKPLKANL